MLNRAHSKFMHNAIIHKHNYICSTSSSIHAYFMLCLLKRNQLLKQYKYSEYLVHVPAFSATRVYRWCKMREGQAFGSNLKYKHFLYMLMNRASTPPFLVILQTLPHRLNVLKPVSLYYGPQIWRAASVCAFPL